uniref:Cell adhesion molecule 4 n=1 Tax=Astyanax mexicanus TaxID=7994 RepID=A0A8B9KES9_ASTMX
NVHKIYCFLFPPLPLPLSLCLSGVVSQQENGKTVSVSNTIRLPVERKDNGAALSCEASHPALVGQKRVRHYRLDVHFAPTVRIIPPQGILREGDSLSLTCSATGNPLPRNIQWSRVNDTLPERAETSGTTLVMSRLSQSHNGTYLCQAHNNYGRAADHYTLLVYENVSVSIPPSCSSSPNPSSPRLEPQPRGNHTSPLLFLSILLPFPSLLPIFFTSPIFPSLPFSFHLFSPTDPLLISHLLIFPVPLSLYPLLFFR